MEAKSSLEKLGFSEKEAVIYLMLLRVGKTTPARLAKITKLNRPTVYSVVRTLISKGVIAEDLADRSLQLVPLPLESLKVSIERSKKELKEKEQIADQAIEDLRALTAHKSYSVPRIRFIEQGEVRDFLYHNIDKWWKTVPTPEPTMYGFQDHSFTEHYQDWIEWAAEKIDGKRSRVRLFSNISEIEDVMKQRTSVRDVRYLEGSQFDSTTWVVGDYIVMIYTRTAPFYLVEIHDVAMAKNMNEIFKTMWAMTTVTKKAA